MRKMRKKLIITLFIMIIIIQSIMPIIVYADNSKEEFKFTRKESLNGEFMSHVLYSSPGADEVESIPLIIWLHGSDVAGAAFLSDEEALKRLRDKYGLPEILENWSMEGFNAYVLCPMIRKKWMDSQANWEDNGIEKNLEKLIKNFIKEHDNVDTNKIILVGHSLRWSWCLEYSKSISKSFLKIGCAKWC